LRVVFDTNIFISAFAIPGGRAEEAYLHAVDGSFELFTSVSILTETANILRVKFDWSDARIEQFLRSIGQAATVLKTRPHLHLLTDEPDNRILECAELAEANVIVTGDRHLLSLTRHGTATVFTLTDFLRSLER
jgi:putative PIN family toxin of toxin-antitoxin system